MENWNNLNIYLTRANEDSKIMEKLAKDLIDHCVKNDKIAIKNILKMGAPINCNDEHVTPLIACMQNDNSDLGAFLIKAGARISFKPTANFEDAFWYALRNKKYTFLRMFVDNRCILEWSVPKTEKESPRTPLIYSTIDSDLKAVEIMLSHYNIKVNERDGKGNTALHYNVSKEDMSQDDIEIGRLLIAAGADTSSANLEGHTPADLSSGNFVASSMLLSGKLEDELVVNEEVEPTAEELLDQIESGVSKTKNKKMKI
jgi:ankyrin repeat protein